MCRDWAHPPSPRDPSPSTSLATAHNTSPRGSRALSPRPAPSPYTDTASGSPPPRSPPSSTPSSHTGDTLHTKSPAPLRLLPVPTTPDDSPTESGSPCLPGTRHPPRHPPS